MLVEKFKGEKLKLDEAKYRSSFMLLFSTNLVSRNLFTPIYVSSLAFGPS